MYMYIYVHVRSVFDAARAASLEKAKQYYGSARIQGIARGFLARVRCKLLLLEYRAGGLLVRIARGKLGRMRWMMEYWKSISVVKSPEALAAIIDRSIPKRDSKEASGPSWREMYDPVTGAFWYYERKRYAPPVHTYPPCHPLSAFRPCYQQLQPFLF